MKVRTHWEIKTAEEADMGTELTPSSSEKAFKNKQDIRQFTSIGPDFCAGWLTLGQAELKDHFCSDVIGPKFFYHCGKLLLPHMNY